MPAAQIAKAVPFFDYARVFIEEEDELIAILREAGRRGAFILQRDLARFESNLAAFTGARHAIGVANATDGLHLALRAAGGLTGSRTERALRGSRIESAPRAFAAQDEIIFSSHTMVATAAAIHFAGATPVPVECGADHLIDPQAVEAAITPRTRAILPTQLNGRTADMEALGRIAAKHDLWIVEDAAQALGSRFKGRAAGTFGAAGVISFFPAKVLGCLGDGGAVISNDDAMGERIRQLHDHGRDSTGEVVSWGLNSRLDNLQAAILDFRLQTFDHAIERRRAIARQYRAALSSIEEIVLAPGPDGDADHFDVYQNYEIEAEDRDELREFLRTRGIGTIVQWGGKAVHQFEALGLRAPLARTDALFRRLLLLPMNPLLSESDVSYVCETIAGFYHS